MAKVKFEDVVQRVNVNVDRNNTHIKYYVGGEHIESNEFIIHDKGLIEGATIGYKFHYGFKPGHILFMSRNPHLRKASMANFEGICSDSTYVVESRDKSILLQDYLLLVMQSNHFWNWMEEHKSGGVNYLINYRTLNQYEFDLPSLRVQKDIVSKAWAAYRLKEAYKRLLTATDEMVKSQFLEMNSDIASKKILSDLLAENFPGEWGSEPSDNDKIKVIRTTNFTNEGKLDLTDVVERSIDSKKVAKKHLKKGDIILERSGGTKDNPVGRVVIFEEDGEYMFNNFTQLLRPNDDVNSTYLFYYLLTSYNVNKTSMRAMASQTTGIQNLNMTDYLAKTIELPSDDVQTQFEAIYRQADKSKFDGFKSQFLEMFGNPVTNPKCWPTEQIKDVAPESPAQIKPVGKTWLLNLDMIEPQTGDIIEKVYEEAEDTLSVQPFDCGIVLFSKLRPYLNKVVAPDENGMATTELVPLRPKVSKLNKIFLVNLLRSNQFVSFANEISGGTKMPRMPLSELRKFNCILPPMEHQNRFEAIYRQADKSKYYELN